MEGRKKYLVREEVFTYTSDGDYCYKYRASMPTRVLRYVHNYAFRAGWTGCHWDAPDIVDTYFPDK